MNTIDKILDRFGARLDHFRACRINLISDLRPDTPKRPSEDSWSIYAKNRKATPPIAREVPATALRLIFSLRMKCANGSSSTGESDIKADAIPIRALANATSESVTPAKGPTIAPPIMESAALRFRKTSISFFHRPPNKAATHTAIVAAKI